MPLASYLEQMFSLKDQVAVVIGGAGVLGGALCRGLVQAGAHVVVADLTVEGCQARVKDSGELRRQGQLRDRQRHQPGFDRQPAGPIAESQGPGGNPRQLGRGQRRKLVPGGHRRRLGPGDDDQSQGRFPGLPDLRPADGRPTAAGRSSISAASPATCRCRASSPMPARSRPSSTSRGTSPASSARRASGSTPSARASFPPSRTASSWTRSGSTTSCGTRRWAVLASRRSWSERRSCCSRRRPGSFITGAARECRRRHSRRPGSKCPAS